MSVGYGILGLLTGGLMPATKTARKSLSAVGALSQKTNVLSLPDLTSVDPNLPKWVNSKFNYPKQKIRIGT